MIKIKISIVILLTALVSGTQAQVRIRIFADKTAESVIFTPSSENYIADSYNTEPLVLIKGKPVIIAKLNGRLVLKLSDNPGLICDSVRFSCAEPSALFSVRINGKAPLRQNYSDDLICYPDLGTILMINIPDIETYIAGVVRAEGGSGKNIEYFRTQAVIARTYMYKYFDKHITDRYNLCDNTHCQAYNGISTDTIINSATHDTHNMVILGPDSTLIISAFHSNCGGETVASENAWLTSQPYLKKVVDPYCLTSRNATWERKTTFAEWAAILQKAGYKGPVDDASLFNFTANTRSVNYLAGSFSVPVNTIRSELKLRSTFFSVKADSTAVTIKGRGYGHGVGLCQEGAMVMASKGFNYKQIIDFYYFGVIITDIKNAKPETPLRTLR